MNPLKAQDKNQKVRIDLRNLPSAMNPVYVPLLADTRRYLVLCGGGGSGKSVFAVQKLLARIVSESNHFFLGVRKVKATIRSSQFAEIRRMISQWGWTKFFRFHETDMEIQFLPNMNKFGFVGMDDPEKLKSIVGVTGVWCEEATGLDEADFDQIDLRLRGITEHYKQILLTFNPIDAQHWLKRRFFDKTDIFSTTALRTTFRDNLYIDDEYRKMLERMAEQNPSWYRVYGQGEWGLVEGRIFPPPIIVDFPDKVDDLVYGVDFGFAKPTAVVKVGMSNIHRVHKTGDIYLHELVYEPGLTTGELIERMRALKIHSDVPMYCDSAEPDRIKEIRAAGFNAKSQIKTPGSVNAGINALQTMKLHCTGSSQNLLNEFGGYVWNTKVQREEPVKENDHLMDAFRAAVYTRLKRPEPVLFSRCGLGA